MCDRIDTAVQVIVSPRTEMTTLKLTHCLDQCEAVVALKPSN